MDDNVAPTPGIAAVLSVLGWVSIALSVCYGAYAVLSASSNTTSSLMLAILFPVLLLPGSGIAVGLMFLAVAAIVEKLSGIEHILKKQMWERKGIERSPLRPQG
jgi:hypothetical protein